MKTCEYLWNAWVLYIIWVEFWFWILCDTFLSVAVQVYKMQYHQQGEKRAVGVLIPALQKSPLNPQPPKPSPAV